MSLLTYSEARPWAKAIKQAVSTKKMPPWFADPSVGHFKNDPSLSTSDLNTLVAWADGGAKEGNAKDAPAAMKFSNGWGIGIPDLVLEMPTDFKVPSEGKIDYQYIVIPTKFTEDRWVQAVEARPGNRAVVHHVIAFIREPGSKWLDGAEPGVVFTPDQLPKREGRGGGQAGLFAAEMLVGFAPGTPPEVFHPGQARLIKAGSDIVFQLHYTASGKEATDRSKVGLVFAKEPPKERVMTLAAFNGRFAIPAGADDYRVDAAMTIQGQAKLLGLAPHMHMRGKAFSMSLTQPGAPKADLLKMKWDFNWQLWYELPEPVQLTQGSKIEATAWYDNTANNKYNPDPSKEVRWGDQSWDEMMIGFFAVSFDAKMNPAELLRPPKKPAAPSSAGIE